jgi:adenylate cyclase
MNKQRAFVFSLVFWLIFIGLFVGVRFVGTGFKTFFLDSSSKVIIFWLVGSIIFATLFWFGLLIENLPKIRRKAYYKLIFLKAGLLVIAVLCFTFVVTISRIIVGTPIKEALFEYASWVFTPLMLVTLLYIFSSAIIISFFWQMSIKVGPNVLVNLLLGKYHNPSEEFRIFMFLDMKSSTTITEKLGNLKYSKLIQECFEDLTESAIMHQVEIYQYVGDEAVLTWKLANGMKNNNCVYVFYDFLKSLEAKKDYYTKQFGVFPEFKAGLNSGPVVVTEVGIIKREIAYHSDVLNTAARIQGKCNELNAQLLITGEVKDALISDKNLLFEDAGIFELRGKQAGVRLFKGLFKASQV